ncbi:MAG: hypothetical protein P4L56_29085 [Candidatus Sulfopaludibacter sp.]|nr:hypothetical protein [Candidatus Sulfopaludibacter sp.]
MRISAFLALLLAVSPGIIQAQCSPSPAVQTAIDELPTRFTRSTWQKYDEDLRALRARFPQDLFVQRKFIQRSRRKFGDDKVLAEYKARHDKQPDDPVSAYLYALALEGRQSGESIKIFKDALAKSPGFPWPHLGLAEVYSTPVFLNNQERLKHLQSFLTACPDALEGYSYLTDGDGKAVLASYAAKLRVLLLPCTDYPAIGAYAMLWSLEFKAQAPSEYDGVRQQIAEDLQRIRALKREDQRQWYYTLEEGYKLAKDQKQADWAHDERQRKLPEAWELYSMSKWYKEHPQPNSDDSAAKKRAYYADLLKQSDQWLKQRPEMARIWDARLQAMEYLDDVSAADVLTAVNTDLRLTMDDMGPAGLLPSEYLTIARVLWRKHLEPERLVELAQKVLAEVKEESAQPIYFDGDATQQNLQYGKFYRSVDAVTGCEYEATGYVDWKQLTKARLVLTRMEDELQTLKAAAGEQADFKKDYTTRLATWWALMARTAELEGHDQDAMAYYEHSLLSRFEAQYVPETGLKDEVADNARRMWARLGGTNEGWQLWYGSQANVLATQSTLTWQEVNEPLPAFELTDLKGKTWTQALLKGKTTFLNFWASW